MSRRCKKLICRICGNDFRVNPKSRICEWCQKLSDDLLILRARSDRLKAAFQEVGMTYRDGLDLDDREDLDAMEEWERQVWEDVNEKEEIGEDE